MTEQLRFFVPYPVTGSRKLRPTGRAISPLDIAHALATNPVGVGQANAVVVLRLNPQPILAIVGYFDASAQTKFDALHWQLDWSLSRLRYVDYQRAEADCTLLAQSLIAHFGRDELQNFRFTAIPRGGLIVLGILSYLLQLERDQLGVSAGKVPEDTPLVVVDDCALTGLRFGEFLQQLPERPVVFAPLYSHPDLRQAILSRESDVIACLSARDLHDYAPQQLREEYQSWRERLLERSSHRCYWVGLPDHICFAWNEPDIALWNSVAEQEEPGWRVLPPRLCLSNRPPPGRQPMPVQIQPVGKGPLKPSDVVLFGKLKGELIVGNIETGISYSLEGVAADMWQAIVTHGNVDDVITELAEMYEVDEAHLRVDIEGFASRLLDAQLLEYIDDGPNG